MRLLSKQNKHKGKRDRRNIFTLLGLFVALVLCVVAFTPLNTRITQGLDIQGGLSIIMTAKTDDGSAVTDDQMNSALNIIQNRVNALGASEATVQRQGSDSILVQIPGIDSAEEALQSIGQTGKLEFVDLRDITDETAVTAIRSGGVASSSETDITGRISANTTGEGMGVTLEPGTYTAFMTGESIENVTIGNQQNSSYYAVDLRLDSTGTEAFSKVSSELVATHGQIAIVLDGVVQSAPAVQSAITNGQVEITGGYSQAGATALKAVLESGSLPITLEYSQSQVVGPTLGQQSLQAGLYAALFGLALVAVYLIVFYKGLGVITAVNLIVFAVLYLGILAVLSYFDVFALSLAGIAGIVLTIGMAADSSILVLERFKEELRMGRSVKAASISGVRHAIGTSIDADLVTFVSALALFLIALGSVKGFGLTLGLGIICDIITMLAFKAPIIRLLAPKAIASHPGFWGTTVDLHEGELAQQAALAKGAARV